MYTRSEYNARQPHKWIHRLRKMLTCIIFWHFENNLSQSIIIIPRTRWHVILISWQPKYSHFAQVLACVSASNRSRSVITLHVNILVHRNIVLTISFVFAPSKAINLLVNFDVNIVLGSLFFFCFVIFEIVWRNFFELFTKY